MTASCQIHNLKHLANEPTSYKTPNNTTCIDLIMTNRPKSFQNSRNFETGLSDFHTMALTVLKVLFKKLKTRVLKYRRYKFCNNHIFQEQFPTKLNYLNVCNQDNGLNEFQEAYFMVLNSVAAPKRKFIRTNQTSFMNEELYLPSWWDQNWEISF